MLRAGRRVARAASSSPRQTLGLGALTSDPSEEFAEAPFPATTRRWQVRRRILGRAAERIFDPASMALLGGTTLTIFGIGVAEACVLVSDLASPAAAVFAPAYAAANMIPSCLGSTLDARLVATALGLSPSELLEPLWTAASSSGQAGPSAPVASPLGGFRPWVAADGAGGQQAPGSSAAAMRAVAATWLGGTRCMAATFMLLAQVVRSAAVVARCGADYRDDVMAGAEPLAAGCRGRFVRLCGVTSDVTSLSLAPGRCGEHLVPVFTSASIGQADTLAAPAQVQAALRERARLVAAAHARWPTGPSDHRSEAGLAAPLAARVGWPAGRGSPVSVPVYWGVGAGAYGEPDAWGGLEPALGGADLVRTGTGRRLLIVEADTTNPGAALALARRSSDLSISDAAMGFRQVEAVARRAGGAEHAVRVLRVVLGDSLRPISTGGGGETSVRERLEFTGEADVVVDSRAPILLALLRWLGSLRGRQTETADGGARPQEGTRRRGVRSPSAADVSVAGWLAEALLTPADPPRSGNGTGAAPDDGAAPPDPGSVMGLGKRLQDALFAAAAAAATTAGDGGGGDAAPAPAPQPPPEGLRQIVVDTGSEEYFDSLAQVLREAGFEALDATAVRGGREGARALPRLVYHGTTARTVAVTLAMIRAGAVDPGLTCAIVDTAAGRQELEAGLRGSKGSRLEVICAASLWDDLLRAVRLWARQGIAFAEIQEELDARFHRVLRGQRRLAEAIHRSQDGDEHGDDVDRT